MWPRSWAGMQRPVVRVWRTLYGLPRAGEDWARTARETLTKHGYIHVYRLLEGKRLQLLHKTQVEDVPYALIEFKGRLAASVGRLLRIYDLGRRKLLKKCESKAMPTFVGSIQVHASRLYVSDMAESVHFFRYARLLACFGVLASPLSLCP